MSVERWRGWAVGSVLFAAAVAGCSSNSGDDDAADAGKNAYGARCSSLCTAQEDAICGTPDHTECVMTCTKNADAARTAQCPGKWDTYFACAEAAPDACHLPLGSDPPCRSELVDVNTCLEDYCRAHPQTAYCN